MFDLYLNTNPIKINLINKKGDVIDELKINFPDKWIELNNNNKTTNIFSNKQTSKFDLEVDKKDKIYNVKNFNLLAYTTIEEFKYIIATILKIDYVDISNVSTINKHDYVYPEDEDRCKNFKWIHENDRLTDIDAYYSTTSIGYQSFVIDILYSDKVVNIDYGYKFYNNYLNIKEYINNMLKNNKNVLTKEYINNTATVQNVEILLIYGTDKGELMNDINIVKLFNIIHPSTNLKKILINDDSLTSFNNEDREMQYIKTQTDLDDPFKNTFSRYNCCGIYVTNEIFPGVTLSRLEIYKSGLIKCCFIINDPDIKLNIIKDLFIKYFDKNNGKFWKLFNKLHVEECIYSFDFDINNFVPVYNAISYIFTLDNVKSKLFKNSFNLVNQEIPTIVYKTNTSSFLSVYSSFSFGAFYNYYYSKTFHNIVTISTMKMDVLSHAHLQATDDDSIVCYISKCFVNDDLIMNALLLLPIFDISTTVTKEVEDYDNLPPLEKLNIIRKKYQKIPTKKAIKKLIEIDPVLFGNRKINDTDYRPYSALAQKREQRVVSITKQEYDIIYNINSEFVSNIKNQSQSNQRLYLFCPFEGFENLNYHHYHNQLCIPKCTTAITKRSQYMYCNNQLDAKNVVQAHSNDVSKMIVYYSPLLLPGRKCRPPDELFVVCENYILYKLGQDVNLYNYCMDNYGLPPYIITRNNIDKYYIINTEIEQNQDYVLCIQSELDSLYYVVIEETDGMPYKLSEHNELFMFFKSIQVNKNIGYEFFVFLDMFFDLDISAQYETKTFRQLMESLTNEHNLQLITDIKKTTILAVKKKDLLLFTPMLQYDKNVLNTENYKNINIVLGNSKFPKLSNFENRRIRRCYVDYKDHKIHLIEVMNTFIIIEPCDYDNTLIAQPTFIDYTSYYNQYLFAASGRLKEKKYIKYKDANELLNIIYIYIYILYNLIDFKDSGNLKEILKKTGFVTNQPSVISYVDDKTKIISWRNSKINENDYDLIIKNVNLSDTNLLIDIVYNELNNNMYIYNINDNEKITNKIITNNTL